MRRLWLLLPVVFLLAPSYRAREPLPYHVRAVAADDAPSAGTLPSTEFNRTNAEQLARTDPLTFLRGCLESSRREVRGYRAVVHRRERLQGELQAVEIMEMTVREQPFSVYVNWQSGGRLARRTLFVEGENDSQILALPALLGPLGSWSPIFRRDPDSVDARQNGRYSIRGSGLLQGIERTITDWQAAARHGELDVDYQGVQSIREVGGRRCHVLHRHCRRAEFDGIRDVTVFVDEERYLQTGSRITGSDGLIGEYYFGEVVLNPTFEPDQFKPAVLNR